MDETWREGTILVGDLVDYIHERIKKLKAIEGSEYAEVSELRLILDKFVPEEGRMVPFTFQMCPVCVGTGVVPINNNTRGVTKCTNCNGSGVV